LNKTPVNVQPLSPPVFDKIVKISKNLRVFILVSFLYHNLSVVVIFIDFWLPFWLRRAPFGYAGAPIGYAGAPFGYAGAPFGYAGALLDSTN
jgi:hypothetical protein